jgi:hypothetical protein|tara:strand:- start:3 stop:188 length:186 start_codon:yes stop_codon:yes gene_type:complete
MSTKICEAAVAEDPELLGPDQSYIYKQRPFFSFPEEREWHFPYVSYQMKPVRKLAWPLRSS